tara:strand:+ start:3752 stop:3952 length:201 start_codon:yes stop_codon:yes gene_type:complete
LEEHFVAQLVGVNASSTVIHRRISRIATSNIAAAADDAAAAAHAAAHAAAAAGKSLSIRHFPSCRP